MSSALPEPEEYIEPKAACPSCGRPVASQRSSQCIYCGRALPVKLRPSVVAERSAEVAHEFAMLEAGPAPTPTGTFGSWAIRLGALGLGALLVMGLLGPCMNR